MMNDSTEEPGQADNTAPDQTQSQTSPPPQETEVPPPMQEAPRSVNDPNEQLEKLKQRAAEAFKSGTEDARDTFERNFPRARENVEKGFNDASYAIGYALSFGSTLIREFTPANVSEGFERGTAAGARAAEEVVQHRKTKREESDPEEPEPAAG